MFLRFAYQHLLYILIPLILLAAVIRVMWHQKIVYRHSMVAFFARVGLESNHFQKTIFFLLRLATLFILAFLIAKPQLVDPQSKVTLEGVDIMLVLDVSGSMQFIDDKQDRRTRFDIAKAEAIRFVQKRTNDAMGLVIFGNDALSRCPITHDKLLLRTIIEEMNLGDIDPNGTKLSMGMATALNRLKNAKAASKIMILLTDGEPSPGDMNPNEVIAVAKKLGVKIYTIGIGSEKEEIIVDPLMGFIAKGRVNTELLHHIASATGGKSFMAQNAKDMRDIYDTIDSLERTRIEAPIFTNYTDIFIPFIYVVMGLVGLELILSTFVWFGL